MAEARTEQQVPLAAQIPLSSFTLPTFPPEASQLRALTLTSDINLNDYQIKHLAPGTFEPSTTIPSTITHLTLELFSLGFPAPFLRTLGKALPNLQSLTLFSCLVDGIDESSRQDALAFFTSAASSLRELHIVDSFARAGFWKSVGEVVANTIGQASKNGNADTTTDFGLKVLEVSYTYRGHYESDFLNRINGEEWAEFISPNLVGLSLTFSPPSTEESDTAMRAEIPEDQEDLKAHDGILPYASDGRASLAVRKRFELSSGRKAEQPPLLKVLDLSIFALRSSEVGEIAYSCAANDTDGGLVGLTASVLLENGWFEKLVESLGHHAAGKAIESLEIVGVPTSSNVDSAEAEKLLVTSLDETTALSKVCPKLERFEMSILKSREIGMVVSERGTGGEKWSIQRNRGTVP